MPQTNQCVADGNLPPDIYTENLATTLTYAINFEYVAEADVVVYREQPAGTFTLLTNSAATGATPPNYTINEGVDPSVVTFAENEAPGGVALIIGRRTNICDPLVEYQVGASIRAQDLNLSNEQLLFLIQETRSILGFMVNGNDTDPIIPGTGMDLNDLDDVNVGDPVSPDPALLRFNGTEWVGNTVLESGDDWVSNNTTFATTSAGDDRWLNATGGDIIGGAGIETTEASGAVTIAVDLAGTSGLEFDGAGNAGELRIDANDGCEIVADGLNAETTAASIIQTGDPASNTDPAIRVATTLGTTTTNTDLVITGGTGVSVTRNSDTELTIEQTTDNNTTYDLSTVAATGNVNLRLTSTNPAGTDDVLITAGNNVTFGNITADGFTINAAGGGTGGGDGVTVVADVAGLNALVDLTADPPVEPDDGEVVLIQNSTNLAADAANGDNDEDVDGLPMTVAAGGPIGGYGNTIQVTVSWDADDDEWIFIRWAPTNMDARYINEVDGTQNTAADRQNIRFNGLDLVSGTTAQGADIVGYEMRFANTGAPRFQINADDDGESADFQLSFGDQGGGGDTHGVFMTAGDENNRNGRIDFTGTNTGNERVLAYTDRGGTAWNLDCNGDFDTIGSIEFANIRPTAGQNRFTLGLSSTPTETYTIQFPAAPPNTGNNWTLQCDIAQDADTACNFAWREVTSGGTGGGNDRVFIENTLTVTTDYELTAGTNAQSIGPIAVNENRTVTIPVNRRWVIS